MADRIESSAGSRVLIVDNAPFARQRLRMTLEDHGYEVVAEAEDTRQAVAQYRKHRPDIVTLDLLLEHEHGFKTLDALQRIDPDVRVVVISAVNDRSTVDTAYSLGVSGFVGKSEAWEPLGQALEEAASPS